MKGDFSRSTFRKEKHYRKVNMQQGRVQLDSDWNEQSDIHTYYERTALQDIIGNSGTQNGSTGFSIIPNSSPSSFKIGAGRYYVDGILCENEVDIDALKQPDLPLSFDQQQYLFHWDDVPGNDNIKLKRFLKQNFELGILNIETLEFKKNDQETVISASDGSLSLSITLNDEKNKADKADLIIDTNKVFEFIAKAENSNLNIYYKFDPLIPNEAGTYLAYLDVWERHLTFLDDHEIAEPALGGVDTTTRTKILWQVKLIKLASGQEYTCSSIPSRDDLIQLSTGTLQARSKPPKNADIPSILPPYVGYRGLENQLYRVEIHDPGEPLTGATFKWSRDNGAVVTRITDISEMKLTVTNTGRDKLLGFAPGQWVEIVDDRHELWGIPGTLARLTDVSEDTLTFDVSTVNGDPLSNENYPQELNPKARRWDSSGIIAISITAENDGYIELEDGIEVRFAEGTYKTKDYWLIPARTITGDIEWPHIENTPEALSPQGIEHHLCPLAILEYNKDGIFSLHRDCRNFFQTTTHVGEFLPKIEDLSKKYDKVDELSTKIKELSANVGEFLPKIEDLSKKYDKVDELSTKIKELSANVGELSNKVKELSANTGIIQFNWRSGHDSPIGPFKHSLENLSEPPVIILDFISDSFPESEKEDLVGVSSQNFIATDVNKETFKILATTGPKKDLDIKLRWLAIPVQEKGGQPVGDHVPRIIIDPPTISIGKSAKISICDPEANKDPSTLETVRVQIKASIFNEHGALLELESKGLSANVTDKNNGIYEVKIKNVGRKTVECENTEPLQFRGDFGISGGAITAVYRYSNGKKEVTDVADIPKMKFGSIDVKVTNKKTGEKITDANIYLDNALASVSYNSDSYTISNVPIGSHSVKVEKLDYHTYEDDVKVNESEPFKFDVPLEKSHPTGLIKGMIVVGSQIATDIPVKVVIINSSNREDKFEVKGQFTIEVDLTDVNPETYRVYVDEGEYEGQKYKKSDEERVDVLEYKSEPDELKFILNPVP